MVNRGGEPYVSPLWAIEAGSGDGDADVHVVSYPVKESLAACDAVGGGQPGGEVEMAEEGGFHFFLEPFVGMAVVVEQAIHTYGVARGHEASAVYLGTQRPTGTDAHKVEASVLGKGGAGGEVEVGGGIQFGGDDVDVVAPHASGECRETAAVVGTREGMQFAVVGFDFYGLEEVLECVYPVGVAYQQNVVGKLFAGEVNVVKAPVGSQYQFAFFD